ncbi:hypothetical protein [Microseira wollei]|uniref:hypothetical protein n=1 Tax=Microseira wollei TaxID=467598 RepID=UPI001CFCE404|nr:hypothetical protein [Microseira wollei]
MPCPYQVAGNTIASRYGMDLTTDACHNRQLILESVATVGTRHVKHWLSNPKY